ncbi:PREDICTED: protein FAM13A isoform X2 [Nicrophorus vespilloides]|nr:PREDICTED: protein FAM13A isoform X2 [Nicrophorus vespilloides]XP_017786479.1 PREDICTED: protein FAM13A isoform X2 [Nicrophorus vespilloides]XP_017786480.1 PREDICTED: protein FAM13A isoform X2 [Nicrophorus vespilloides]
MVDPDVMKGPHTLEDTKRTSNDRESKFARVKRMLTCQSKLPSTYDEARASVKARKRKERQESIGSISQERKVIRSNSEERPITTKNDIRRVSSNEDFQKSPSTQNNNDGVATPAVQDGPIKISSHREIDDGEFEKRRSHERFSRPLLPRGGRYNQTRKPKTKHFPKASVKDKALPKKVKPAEESQPIEADTDTCNFLQLVPVEKERSPSPVHTPVSPALDITTLHQQIDCCDPIPSYTNRDVTEINEIAPSLSVVPNRLLSSPRNSVIITQRIYLNPDVPQHTLKDPKNPVEQRLKQLAKQINSLKKKIKKYDEEFEVKYGYKPSHADKLNEKSIKKLCTELSKLKKEQKQLQEDATSLLTVPINNVDDNKPTALLKDTILEIEKKLETKRIGSERSLDIEELSNEQLVEEKIAVQKSLLYLESVHGRPTNKEDKDLARPLYDRYRSLKRMVARLTMANNIIELATIHEHETMDFVSLPTQTVETESEKLTLTGSTTDSDTDTSIGENLHAMSLEELTMQQRMTNEEKKQLRRSLKEFEANFESTTGRKLQKEDRSPMETVYISYKKAKAKLRLLDALVGKQIQAR